jgi:hypothetical protein
MNRDKKIKEIENEEKNIKRIVGMSIVAMGIVFGLGITISEYSRKDYKEILNSTQIASYISNVEIDRGTYYLTFEDGSKFRFSSYDLGQDPKFDLTSSNWFQKLSGSDTVSLTKRISSRESKTFKFVLTH